MKRLITLILIFCSLSSIGQILNASYTTKGATVPFINSSSYKLNGVTLDSANTVKRGFFTPFQYNKLQSIATLYKLKSDSVNLGGFATNFKLNQKVSSQWVTTGSDIYYTTGNVGIGTSETSRALNVGGSSYFKMGNDDIFSIYDTQNNYLINFIEVSNLLYSIDPSNIGYSVGIGTSSPEYKLDVNGTINASAIISTNSVKVGDDSTAASSANVGAIRYRVSGDNSYCEMVMQTGVSTYAWVVIKTNSW